MTRGLFTAVTLFAALSIGHSQDLKGAKSAVERFIEAPKTASDSNAAFETSRTQFLAAAPTLSPSEAARRWVALINQAYAVPSDSRSMSYELGGLVESALLALPRPESWPSLSEAFKGLSVGPISTKQRAGFDLFASVLTGDRASQERTILALTKGIDLTDENSLRENYDVITLYKDWAASTRNTANIKKSLILAYSVQGGSEYFDPAILLLSAADRDEVAKVFFENSSRYYEPYLAAEELKAYYRAAAIKYGKKNSSVIWQTLSAFGTTAQFEAYCRQNGKFLKLLDTDVLDETAYTAMEGTQGQSGAVAYYVANLVLDGRTTEAEKIMTSAPKAFGGDHFSDIDVEAMKDPQGFEKLAVSLSRVLTAQPTATYWGTFVTVSHRAARGDLLLATAQKAAANPAVKGEVRFTVESALARGHLAVGQTDQAIALLLASLPKSGETSTLAMGRAYSAMASLLELGAVLKRNDLVDAAIKAQSNMPSEVSYYSSAASAQALMRLGRYAEAEEALVLSIISNIKSQSSPFDMMFSGGGGASSSLLNLYSLAGRHEDVLYLLQNAPIWEWTDLGQAIDSGDTSVVYIAARALLEVGRKEEAVRLATAALYKLPGNDRGYEVLVEAEGQNAIATLDKLFALDQFEERPLVWKAKVLLDMGRHEEAEAVARQAIAIDPSDGEQGKGDRMRVYAVLSDILAKRGDAAQSQVYANAVRAIRLSEDADDFYAAGMSSRAIAMYQEALTIFEDAYCIQSRLALQLLEAGRSDEAAVHFRKAFELMPDSFGRIESHCFGCEHLFESAQAQDIALSVLQQLLKDRPDKPQVSYLLGYLLSSRQKHVEAATHLERAVELDPQYINAWILLLSTYESTGAPAAKRDKAALAIASLDPLGKHSTAASVSGLTDFAKLWNLGNQAFLNAEKGAGGLFELTATKRLFESLPEGMSVYSMGSADVSSGPAVYLLASPLISGIMNLISGGYSLWGETMSIGG